MLLHLQVFYLTLCGVVCNKHQVNFWKVYVGSVQQTGALEDNLSESIRTQAGDLATGWTYRTVMVIHVFNLRVKVL